MEEEYKICSMCKEKKLKNRFAKDKRASDGLASSCKDCNNAHYRDFYKKNIEKQRQRGRDYLKDPDNHEKALNRSREWYRNNKEKIILEAILGEKIILKNLGNLLENQD
jgi:hypothetical protein